MAALVRCNCNGIGILLYGTIYNLGNATVVAQVDNLGTRALQYAAHNVYSGIMPVKQRSGGNYTYFMFRFIRGYNFHNFPNPAANLSINSYF
jgi:hypothetical protein